MDLTQNYRIKKVALNSPDNGHFGLLVLEPVLPEQPQGNGLGVPAAGIMSGGNELLVETPQRVIISGIPVADLGGVPMDTLLSTTVRLSINAAPVQ